MKFLFQHGLLLEPNVILRGFIKETLIKTHSIEQLSSIGGVIEGAKILQKQELDLLIAGPTVTVEQLHALVSIYDTKEEVRTPVLICVLKEASKIDIANRIRAGANGILLHPFLPATFISVAKTSKNIRISKNLDYKTTFIEKTKSLIDQAATDSKNKVNQSLHLAKARETLEKAFVFSDGNSTEIIDSLVELFIR